MFLYLFCFSVIFASCNTNSIDGWTGMRVKFGIAESQADKEAFFKIPNNITHGLQSGWVSVPLENHYGLLALAKEKANDYGINGLYDFNGYLAGLHSCQPFVTLNASMPDGYNILDEGTFELKTVGGILSYCTSMLIVSPETLKAGGRTSMAPFGEGIWLRDTTNRQNKYYKQFSTNPNQLQEETHHDMKSCFPFMGSHYFWDPPGHSCFQHYNWFILGKQSKEIIHGVGLTMYGHVHKYWTDWWDAADRTIIEMINKDQPECFYDNFDIYGGFTMHIYFVDDPWNIHCSDGDE